MSILTAEEVEELLTLANGASWRTFARAIEAKVLEKLQTKITELTAERDAALGRVAMWVAANRPEGWIDELRQEAKWRIATCQENEQLKSALREAKSAFGVIEHDSEECLDFDECTAMLVPLDAYHGMSEAIATINKVLGEK